MGHVPYNIAPLLSSFLARDCNHGSVKITGKRLNRGAGYGLEVPCMFFLYGPKPYLERIRKMVAGSAT